MAKTITVRVDEDSYKLIKTAANGVKRTISNFLEFATLTYISNEAFVSDREMDDILANKELLSSGCTKTPVITSHSGLSGIFLPNLKKKRDSRHHDYARLHYSWSRGASQPGMTSNLQ